MRKLIIINSETDIEKVRTLVFEDEEFTAKWTQKIEDDMVTMHNVNVANELSLQLLSTIDEKYDLTNEELELCKSVIDMA